MYKWDFHPHACFCHFYSAENFPPNISTDAIFRVDLGLIESTFNILVTDPNEDDFTFTFEGGLASADVSELTKLSDGEFVYRIALFDLPTLETSPLVFHANDSRGAVSSFIPSLEVCACINGGECTLDGTEGIDATVIMNCICPEGICNLTSMSYHVLCLVKLQSFRNKGMTHHTV